VVCNGHHYVSFNERNGEKEKRKDSCSINTETNGRRFHGVGLGSRVGRRLDGADAAVGPAGCAGRGSAETRRSRAAGRALDATSSGSRARPLSSRGRARGGAGCSAARARCRGSGWLDLLCARA
jgi:hypothetical protein